MDPDPDDMEVLPPVGDRSAQRFTRPLLVFVCRGPRDHGNAAVSATGRPSVSPPSVRPGRTPLGPWCRRSPPTRSPLSSPLSVTGNKPVLPRIPSPVPAVAVADPHPSLPAQRDIPYDRDRPPAGAFLLRRVDNRHPNLYDSRVTTPDTPTWRTPHGEDTGIPRHPT